MIDRFSRIFIPHNGGLTLIGDTDCRDVLCGSSDPAHRLHGYTKHACPDLVCIMLYPARLWKILFEFSLRHAAHGSLLVKQDTTIAGRARIQCHYILCHNILLLFDPCIVLLPVYHNHLKKVHFS